MGKQYEVAFAIGAKLQGQFGAAFKNAQTSVASLQNKIESLNRRQGDISAYQKQQRAVEQTRSKLEVLQKQYENLKTEMGENGEASASLKNAMLQKQLQIEKTTASLEGQEKKLGSMGNALTEAGIDTNNLAKESQSLAAELDSLKSQQEEVAAASQDMGQSMGEAASSMEQLLAAAGLSAALKTTYDLMEQCAEASINFETGMAGVQRTVGGSQSFLTSMGEDFKEMSTVIPITTDSLTGIATTSGQLGVAQKSVESFTTVMAQLDTTTDLTADSAATMLAQFSNITGVTQYDRLGSVVAELGDATATTASKVVEMSQGMAAAAHLAGMSATDIMGISAATGSLGVEAQAGSTAMSTLINTLYKAVETGNGLKDFASVANMSAEQFKQAWGEDAAGALNSFIQGLNDTKRNGKSAIVILDELGINNVRQTKAILGLASAGNLLSNTIAKANTAWEQNTALTQKASIMYNTTGAKLTMAQNAVNNLKIAVGDALTPVIGAGAAALTSFVQPIAVFIQKNPALVKALVAAAAVIGTVTLAITAYAAAAKIAAAASALFTSTIPGLNIIMFATAAIAGLTAGIILLAEAFKSSQESMEELDDEFDDLNADFRKQSNIRSLCAEYKQLQKELLDTKDGFNGLASQDDITVTITASALSTLIPEDFMNPDAEGIKLTAEQVADLVASGFMLKDDEGIILTAQQTADLVASGFLKPDDEGILLKAGQVAELVSSGFMKPDDEGITLKAGQTADLLAKGFLNPEDEGITLSAEQTHELLTSGFLSPNDEGITLSAGQIADLTALGFMNPNDEGIEVKAGQVASLTEAGFMAANDEGITLTAKQTADLVAIGFLNPDDEGITLKAGQTADLFAAGFLSKDDEGITLKAGQTADLLASGFLKADDPGITLRASQFKDLTASGFLREDDEGITLTAKQTANLVASGFLSPDDEGITLTAEQTKNLLSSGFLSPDDEGILIQAAQVADLYSQGFMNAEDPGITITAGQMADLVASGFMKDDDEGITISAQQAADLVASGFLKPDDPGITVTAIQAKDLLAAGFMIDPNEKIPISGSAVKDLEAKGFLKGSDVIEIKGEADKTTKITVDDYIAANDRTVELTANVTNLADVQQAISSLKTEAESLGAKASSAKSDLTAAQTALKDMEQRQQELQARLTHAGTPAAKSEIQSAIEAQSAAIEEQRGKVEELELAYSSSAAQYALTQAAANDLAAKEQHLTEIKAALADETNGVVSAMEKETEAINAQVDQADKLAAAEQAKLRSQIYDNVTKQAKQYADAVKQSGEITAESAGAYDTWNRTLKYAGMNAEEVTAAYHGLLQAFDEKASAPDFVPFSDEAKDAAAEIQALANLMGTAFSDLQQYADGSVSFADTFGWIKTNDTTILHETEFLNERVGQYGDALKELQAIQSLFIQNLSEGVKSGALTAEEAYGLLSTSLKSVGADAETVKVAVEQLNAELGETPEEVAQATASAAEVNAVIQPILDQMNKLSESYTEAYDAAYKSMDGQFKLFEEAPKLTEESVDKMIAALQSQAAYMQEYSANLKAAGEMGLSEGLIAQLSDGSKESAAYLAAIVSDGATKIDELNTAFASVEEGKENFASTVADMQTDFSTKMASLQANLEATVASMNMSADAASAGADTVQAFADAAKGKVGVVAAAFARVAAAAKAALNIGGGTGGYATGTENAERGFKMVGENGPEMVFFNGGEKVLNAQETEAYQRDHAIEAEPINAVPANGGNSGPHIEVKPVFNLSGNMDNDEVRSLLDEQTGRIKEMVEEALEEIESDRERMVYS